jgi:hypothetical protein
MFFRLKNWTFIRERCEAIDRKLNGLINSLQGKGKSRPSASNSKPPTATNRVIREIRAKKTSSHLAVQSASNSHKQRNRAYPVVSQKGL